MRYVPFLLLLFLLHNVSAQETDSLVIRQIDSLILVSRALTGQQDFAQAMEVNAVAERLALETFGPESSAYGSCAFNRGRVNHIQGNNPVAEKYYLQSKEIREKNLGREHPDYAQSLYNLAILYWNLGDYEKAGASFLESKEIREKVLGKEHPDYASSLNNLAANYYTMGNFEKAEPLYYEALAIKEKVLGKEHPDYAGNLNNIAVLYEAMSNYKKAEPLYIEALDIQEKLTGKEDSDYARSLGNLANLYWRMGNYKKAEPLYYEAKAIYEIIEGKEHRDYSIILNNLAVLYIKTGNFKKAELFCIEAISIGKKVLGKEHADYAKSLFNFASLYNDMGNYEKAEPLYLEAIAIQEKVLGAAHPDYAISLNDLARLYEIQNRISASEPLLKEVFTISQTRLVNATSFLSELELAKYASAFQHSGADLSAFLLARQAGSGVTGILPSLAYNNALFYKGFLLTAVSRLNSHVLASPETVEINLLLKGYRRRLAAEYSKPIAERKGITELEEKANLTEKELARTIAGYSEAMKQVNWQDVQTALPETAIALEFVHFQVNFPKETDSVHYAALLLGPGMTQPLFIPLFEEKELDFLLDGDKERKSDYVNELYAWADRGLVEKGGENKSLYELIWAKIQAQLPEGIKTIYYSPSGVLHRLNLGAIAVDDEIILSDQYNLVALNSTRQLVIPATVAVKSNDALLVGGVNFDIETTLPELEDLPLLASRSISSTLSEAGTRGGSWSYLKWTEKEVERISNTLTTSAFGVQSLAGKEATEEAIKFLGKEAPSPRILHMATHGYFFPDPESKSLEIELGESEPVFKSSDNPMIRSGLILAGGNYAWQNGQAPRPDMEDGILTAYEISQMNLSHTELVVLSACETGLGDIQGNEGVYGLQRAFKIAGAKYLIMSLWQIPDRETMEFMTAFYSNWLASQGPDKGENKMSIPDAFRKTQGEMRDRFFNPYSWAGFVLVE